MREFPFLIETAEDQVFEGPVEMVCAQALDGSIGILAGHAPLLTALSAGIVRVKQKGRERQFVVGESLLAVRPDATRILCEYAAEAEGPTDAIERLREVRQWYREADASAETM